MLKDLIDIIKDTALMHKAVNDFHYQSSILTNAQNHHNSFQVIVDDISLSQLLISYSPELFQIGLDIYIIGFVDTNKTVLDVQSQAYDIAIQLIKKIEMNDEYDGILDVKDYSILTLSHYTDDSSAGVKVSIQLTVPVGYCDIDDYFDDEPKDISIEDKEIDLNGNTEENVITLNPIKLPKNNVNKSCGCV